jgi:hypothetical protein
MTKGKMQRVASIVVIFALAGLAIPLTIGMVSPVHAVACPVYSSSFNSGTIDVQITAADGTCPGTYSNSPTIHYALSTGTSENPYTVVLSNCVGADCPPTEIIVQGWAGNQIVCGGTAPACSSSGPWSFLLDATVQASSTCNTAPVKINGQSGSPVTILEAGVGGDCTSTTTTTSTSSTGGCPPSGCPPPVPEFPVGLLPLLLLAIPLLVLIRKHLVGVPSVSYFDGSATAPGS